MTYRAVSFWELRKREAAGFAAGACIAGFCFGWFATDVVSSVEAANHANEPLEAVCKPPVTEGAMTVWVFQNGKSTCWRWKS